jgi:hypothetical protein
MKKFKLIYLAIFIYCLTLISCDELNKLVPNISFDAPFPKRHKNLTYILGDQFTYVSGNDTQIVNVSYDKKSKQNLLTNPKSGDTLSRCWLSHFRQLYYFSEQLNDTSFWIYAVKISDKEIIGLQSGLSQMLRLEREIDKGKYSDLIKYRDTTTKVTLLTYNKTKLKGFYQSIIDSLPVLKIINIVEDKNEFNQTDTITATTSNEDLESGTSIVSSVYPNPAVDLFNIEFEEEGNFRVEIYDIEGKKVKSVQVNSDSANISLNGIKHGTYFVKATQLETNKTALIKLMIHL